MTSKTALRAARERFAALLSREDSLEKEWQQLFTEQPFILSESLPLRLRQSQIVPCARPGRSEADFLIYPDDDLLLPSSYGVIELKRPSTPILATPRQQVIRLSSDAETAHAQAKLYMAELTRELYDVPGRLLAVGGGAHIFLIIGNSKEIQSKIVTDIQRRQFDNLLPGGVELLPFDTIFRMFEKHVSPQIHVVVPGTYDVRGKTDDEVELLQIAPVFISFTRQDSEFAKRLTDAFIAVSVRVWNYQRDLNWERDIQVEIRAAIAEASTVVLVLSQASAWRDAIGWELMRILERQSSLGRDLLIPVALDSSWRESPIAKVLQDYAVLDFSKWKNGASFRKLFEQLIKALQMVSG